MKHLFKKKRIITMILTSMLLFLVSQNAYAYSFEGWRFFKCSTCSTAYPNYKWGDRLDSGSSVLKTGWQNAITSWHGKQSKVVFNYSSSSNSELNSWYESSSTYYGKMTTSYDSFKFVTKFMGYLNAAKNKINRSTYGCCLYNRIS